MPYIKSEDRDWFTEALEELDGVIESPGDLNYCITKLCTGYLKPYSGARYQDYNEVIGVLECAKQELYRRLVAEYEDYKCDENGDVY